MANRVYRGPTDRQPHTVTDKTVSGAYKPGTFVIEGATALTQAAAAAGLLRILGERDYYGGDAMTSTALLETAYTAGESGCAYVIEPGQTYQVAVAADTYTYGQELTVNASGLGAAAAAGNVVVGFAKQAGTFTAGRLIDVEMAIRYAKA